MVFLLVISPPSYQRDGYAQNTATTRGSDGEATSTNGERKEPEPPARPTPRGSPGAESPRRKPSPRDDPASQSILKAPTERSRGGRKPPEPTKRLSWKDGTFDDAPGPELAEVHYAEELHYSPHSRDREVARRQAARASGQLDELDAMPQGRACCVIS